MKKKWKFLYCMLLVGVLAGCGTKTVEPAGRVGMNPETQGGTAITECSEILKKIWDAYTPGERFQVFGGAMENSVASEPGDLDIAAVPMLQQRFFFTSELSEQITEGAALEHLFNRNVFCAGVFRLTEGTDAVQFSHKLSLSLGEIPWTDSKPQRYLTAQPAAGFLLLAYGQTSVLETFLIRMNQVYPAGRILAFQEIKIPPWA